MGHETLKATRFMYPGIIVFVYAFIAEHDAFPDTNPLENFSYYALVIGLAFIYHIFDVRKILWKPIRDCIIDTNICCGIEAIKKNDYIANESEDIDLYRTFKIGKDLNKTRDGKRRIKNAVNDLFMVMGLCDQLQVKSKFVMMNGALLTCLLDNIICGVAVIVFYSVIGRSTCFFVCIILIIVIASMAFVPALIEKHIILSNEQLDIINNNKLMNKHDK